jgi:osmotically-inducible protein OsmY
LPGASPLATRDDRAVPDTWIVRAVGHEIEASPLLANEPIGIDSGNGVVTLRGSVSNRLARERAVEVARVVKGVRAIVDLIDVRPDARPDYELETLAAHTLSVDPVTAGQRVDVRVRAGIAVLSGTVDSAGCARLAESDLLALPGVLHVVDDLTVEPATSNDERLEREAKRLLSGDPWLDATHVDVAARKGIVVLSGWVGTAAEQARAESDVRSASPVVIDVSRLRLDRWTESRSLRVHPPIVRTDAELAQSLADAYVRDPRVSPFVPQTDVHDGLIVLTGVAPNADAARAAAQDARNLPAVVQVADDLKTLPDVVSSSDGAVRSEVRDALDRDPGLASRHLKVDVLRGAVYLRGCVDSDAERVRALAVAAAAPGAHDVEDGLLVGPAGAPTLHAPGFCWAAP